MKSYNHLYEKLLDRELIRSCILSAAKGKRRRPDVRRVLNDMDHHIDNIIHLLETDSFEMRNHKHAFINESSCKKTREIIRPSFVYETIVQHMIVRILQPMIERRLYGLSCASLPDKGITYGKKHLSKFLRKHKGQKLYVYKFDIRKFFDHIDRGILMRKLGKMIRDKRFMALLGKLVYFDACDTGIPLGFYSSQWFANFYLTDLDFYIKQTLQVPFLMRYMDDVVIIHTNVRELHRIHEKVEQFLQEKLRLVVKDNWQIFRFDYHDYKTNKRKGRYIDYMGFKFYMDRVTLRKSTLCRVRRKANRIARTHRLHKKINWYISSQMISKMGWLHQCDSYRYYINHIKGKINMQCMRREVANHSQRISAITKGMIQYAA